MNPPFLRRILLCCYLVLILTSCNKWREVRDGHQEDNSTYTVLMAGQSNMERMEWYAQDALKTSVKRHRNVQNVVLIPCAVGGTWSGQWLPGAGLLESCVEAAKGQKVDAIVYWQGESDAYNSITNWVDHFTQTVAGFRAKLGNIPVVFAQIAYTTDPDWNRGWQSIKDQQASVNISGVKMIKTDDLAVLADTVHIDSASAQRIADRFGAALSR